MRVLRHLQKYLSGLGGILNLPAVAAVNELNLMTKLLTLRRDWFEYEKLTVLGVALGGGVETNPLQMAQAYAAFANGV